MKLSDWLAQKNVTVSQFARNSGIGFRQLVHKYAHGSQFPSPDNLLKIRLATNGEVTADDFVTEHAARIEAKNSPPTPTQAEAA